MIYNKVILAGYIQNDLELNYTKENVPVVSFLFKIYDGKREKAKPNFVRVVAWKYLAEFVCTNFKKGSNILIEGYIQSKEYEKGEIKKQVTEVIVSSVEFIEKRERAEFAQND